MTDRPDNVADLARELAVGRAFADLRALLDANPRLRERTAAMLAGDLDAPDLEEATMNGADEQVSIRCPGGTLARAEALVQAMNDAPEFKALRCTKSAILRLAILRGLEAFEAEHGKPKRRGG